MTLDFGRLLLLSLTRMDSLKALLFASITPESRSSGGVGETDASDWQSLQGRPGRWMLGTFALVEGSFCFPPRLIERIILQTQKRNLDALRLGIYYITWLITNTK